MGHEYKINAILTKSQVSEIKYLLTNLQVFEKIYQFNNNIFWEFRRPENKGKMPNFYIIFKDDGIYICQNGAAFIWSDLEELKQYLENEKVAFNILDYSD